MCVHMNSGRLTDFTDVKARGRTTGTWPSQTDRVTPDLSSLAHDTFSRYVRSGKRWRSSLRHPTPPATVGHEEANRGPNLCRTHEDRRARYRSKPQCNNQSGVRSLDLGIAHHWRWRQRAAAGRREKVRRVSLPLQHRHKLHIFPSTLFFFSFLSPNPFAVL